MRGHFGGSLPRFDQGYQASEFAPFYKLVNRRRFPYGKFLGIADCVGLIPTLTIMGRMSFHELLTHRVEFRLSRMTA